MSKGALVFDLDQGEVSRMHLKDAPALFKTLRVDSYNMNLSELRELMMRDPPPDGWGVDFRAH